MTSLGTKFNKTYSFKLYNIYLIIIQCLSHHFRIYFYSATIFNPYYHYYYWKTNEI
jgi:hypothetical protein